jgi:hypothetical protein
MKKYINVLAAFVICLMLTTACQWIDPKINIDPNNPSDIAPRNGLAAIQVTAGYSYGGDLYRYASLFTQQHFGSDRQHAGIYTYSLAEGDLSTLWSNLYSGHMKELDVMIGKSTALGAPHFRGVARVLMAQSLGNATDVFGDVPFSQAFQGGANFTPKYDTQQDIYTRIQSMLDSAIVDLNSATSSSSPGAEDLIFAGNRPRWVRAAWTLKARYALHLSKRNPQQAAQQALQFTANGLQSSADDMQLIFGSTDDQSNPLYQFDGLRNDIRVNTSFMQLLNRLNDPRRPLFATRIGQDSTQLGAYYASVNSPVVMVSFAEAKFIEAEANLILGNADAAKTAFTNAVRGGLTSIANGAPNILPAIPTARIPTTAAITAYLAQESVVPSGTLTLERLIEQKYIALYPSSEVWTDWRRTGFPRLTAVPGSGQTAIPRRFPYPQSESLFNTANWKAAGASSAQSFLFTRVWWDAQ